MQRAEEFLQRKGVASPRLDAQVLLAHRLGLTRLQLYLRFEQPLSTAEQDDLRELLRRRAAGEPVAYLTGEKEFYSLPFRVDERVLIPRPDSETLVDAAREVFSDAAPASIADVGTGSGCLLCALAREFSRCEGVGVDSDAGALEVAAHNARALGLAERVRFVQGDLLDGVAGSFELVVANLPYVPTDEIERLSPEVRREPRGALDGGPDGLDLIRRLVPQAFARLAAHGWLLLEVGQGQALAVGELLSAAGFAGLRSWNDLSGIERVVGGRRPD